MLRGRVGTEWAAGAHLAGEQFALIQADGVRPVQLSDWVTGSQVSAAVLGTASSGGTAEIIVTGESLRPPAPARLEASFSDTGDLVLSWIRRSRRGWAWIDEMDAPLGESREEYRITVTGPLGTIEMSSGIPQLTIAAAELAPVGDGEATVEIRQIGDWAASRPTQLSIDIA